MKAPDCPDHNNQVLDLARGRLDDRAARQAEEALVGCSCCREWWQRTFRIEAITEIATGVAEGLENLELPRPSGFSRRWLAAASMVLILASGVVWWSSKDARRPETELDPTVQSKRLGSWTVHLGTVSSEGSESLFDSSFESGDLSAWS